MYIKYKASFVISYLNENPGWALIAVPTLPHPSPQHRPMEDLPALCEGDQGLPAHLQGEDGPSLRLCPGQDGAGYSESHTLVRLHQVPQGCRGHW